MKRALVAVAGVAAAAAYLAGAAFTGHVNPGLARPLLDGFAPPAPYRWVNTPHIAGIQYSSQKPASAQLTLHLGPHGTPVATLTTSDSQFNALLDAYAVPPRSGQHSVSFTVTPMDPKALGTAPAGVQFAGNAYRVTAVYQPGGAQISAFHHHNNLALQYPLLALNGPGSASSNHQLLYSKDGRNWQLQHRNSADNRLVQSMIGEFFAPGYYAVGAPASTSHGSSVQRYVLLGVFIAAALIVIAIIAFTVQMRGYRQPSR